MIFSSTFSENTSTCHPGVQCGLGGTVSSSARIFLPPGSCSLQIPTRLQKCGQHEPSSHSPFDLLPSHADTAPSSPLLPSVASAPCPPAAGFSVLCCCHAAPSHGATGRARLSGKATTNTRESHSAWSSHCSARQAKKSVLLATDKVRREVNYWDEWHLRRTCEQAWLAHRLLKIRSISKNVLNETKINPYKSKKWIRKETVVSFAYTINQQHLQLSTPSLP